MTHLTITPNGHAVPITIVGRCKAATPPTATLIEIEMLAADRARIAYVYPGIRRPNRIEVAL